MSGPVVGTNEVFPVRPLETDVSYTGPFRAKVKKVDDRETDNPFLGRIKVWVPQVHGEEYEDRVDDLPWAWPMFAHAHKDEDVQSGFMAMPLEDMWVYVMFEGGHADKPIWFGGWYGEQDRESELNEAFIEDARSSARYPEIMGWVSPFGGKFKMRVLKDERIELVYGDLDDPDAIIEIDAIGYSPNSVPTVRVETKWKAHVKSETLVELESDDEVRVTCKRFIVNAEDVVTVTSAGTSTYEAAGANNFKGATINGLGEPNGGFDKENYSRFK